MSIVIASRALRDQNLSLSQSFFHSPPAAGRKITAGFTYIQRIGKAANFDVWFPGFLKHELEARSAAGRAISVEHFPAQWAAVREFELLQESGNHKIYDLDPANIHRAVRDLSVGMRAGGYRITVATMGCYQESETGDELEILDHTLQERISQMIHMLYLDVQSDEINEKIAQKLKTHQWDYRQALPHIGMVLGAHDLFCPANDDKKKETKKDKTKGMLDADCGYKNAKQFFDILGQLPPSHIIHETAVGLQLPEFNNVNQWNYIASSDETLAAFNRVLGDLFHRHTLHLRGYGDRMTDKATKFYQRASMALGA